MLKQLSTVVLCLAASSSVVCAQVATTGQTVGTVLVNHGDGFAPVRSGAPLAQGDIVSAKKGGRTSIVYAGGCNVKVKPGRTVTIGQTVCDKAGNFQAQAPDDRGPVLLPGVGLPGGGLVLGGAVIAAGGIAAAAVLGAQKFTVGPFPVRNFGGGRPPAPTPASP